MPNFAFYNCPTEPPIDYGRGWELTPYGWVCPRCRGLMRQEQKIQIVEAFEQAGLNSPVDTK